MAIPIMLGIRKHATEMQQRIMKYEIKTPSRQECGEIAIIWQIQYMNAQNNEIHTSLLKSGLPSISDAAEVLSLPDLAKTRRLLVFCFCTSLNSDYT